MLQHDAWHTSMLTSAHVMKCNVMRIKASPCCRMMHSMRDVLMSARAKWGQMQCNGMALKGGTVTLLSLYRSLLCVTVGWACHECTSAPVAVSEGEAMQNVTNAVTNMCRICLPTHTTTSWVRAACSATSSNDKACHRCKGGVAVPPVRR